MRFYDPFLLKNLQLRVVAADDSPHEQAEKLRVRDAVLPVARRDPFALLRIGEAARAVCPGAKARFALYPPCRLRPTIVVRLGAGRGKNWLGMLYPEMFGLPEEGSSDFRWLLSLLFGRWL